MNRRKIRSANAGLAAALRYLLVRSEYQEDSEFAKDADVSPSQVSRYTSGKATPRKASLQRLVSSLEVTVPELELFAHCLDLVYEEIVLRDRGEASGVLALLQPGLASGEARRDVFQEALSLTDEERAELVRYLDYLQYQRRRGQEEPLESEFEERGG